MYDDMMLKTVETFNRVINETDREVWLRISRFGVELTVWEKNALANTYTAYLQNNDPDSTNTALKNMRDILASMLKDGAVGV